MAKLTRVLQLLFGANGDQSHFEQFGAKAQTGNPVFTKDPATIQGGPAFIANGWLDAINAGNKAPFLEDMNGVMLLIFRQLAYIFQAGIPEWEPGTTYFTGSIVTAPGTSQQYGSLQDNNLGNALPNQTSNAFWTYLNPQAEPAGLIKPFAGAGAPFGYMACDGTGILTSSQPALFSAIGHTWDLYRGQPTPGPGLFRVPWLSGLTLIGAGAGGGAISSRSLADFIGEESHTLTVGEMPSHAHGVSDPGHNHTKQFGTPGGGDNNFAMNPGAAGAPQSTQSAGTGISIQANGGGAAHNNMQPSAGINWVIKT